MVRFVGFCAHGSQAHPPSVGITAGVSAPPAPSTGPGEGFFTAYLLNKSLNVLN